MINIKWPCIECMKYPICISKKDVVCSDLYSLFFNSYRKLSKGPDKLAEESLDEIWTNLWAHLKVMFPHIRILNSHYEDYNETQI